MDSKIEPVAWMWEIVVDPTGETVIGKTATQFATHRSTGPDDAKPLYTEAALLAAEQRGRESERGEIVKALSKFVPDYEPSNWTVQCRPCIEATWAEWEQMWADYYASRL